MTYYHLQKIFADHKSLFSVIPNVDTFTDELNKDLCKSIIGLFNGKLVLTQTQLNRFEKLFLVENVKNLLSFITF